MLMPPKELPERYDEEVLRRSDLFRRKTGTYPFNPLRFVPEGVNDIDLEFMNDYEIWRSWVQYFIDLEDSGMTNTPKRRR